MKRALISSAIVFLITSSLQGPSFAVEVHNSPSVNLMSSQGSIFSLGANRKILLQEAKKTMSASIAKAKSAYALLVADAKANRDQLLLSANKDAHAIASARAKYSTDLSVAKAYLDEAIKQANKIYAETVANAGTPLSK